MAGNSSVRGDETVTFTDNMSFDGTDRGGKMTTDGQLFIGSTSSNRANNGGHVRLGQLTSPDNTISIGYSAPNITLQSGSILGKNFPTDDGTAIPSLGVLKLLGSSSSDYTQSGLMTHSNGTTNEVYFENRLYSTKFVVDATTTVGSRGSYSTIASAIAAASSGDTIFIRPGTYTENLTAKAGVTLVSWGTIAGQNEVTIIGKLTITSAGTYTFANINFQTNSDFAISCTGASQCNSIFYNCGLTGQNNTIIQYSNSNGSSSMDIYNCNMDLKTTGIAYFANSGTGQLKFTYTIGSNSGGSTTASTQSDGTMRLNYTVFLAPYTNSGTSIVTAQFSTFNTAAQNVSPWNQNSTNTANSNVTNCFFTSGSAACMTLGAGSSIFVVACSFYTTGSNLTTGTGEIKYSGISSLSTDSAVLNNTTKTAETLLPYATSAASGSGSVRGTASFDSSSFTVTNGFVTLAGGSEAIDSIALQTGTTPIVPTAAGLVTINGGTVAAGTNPVRSNGTGANTAEIQVQRSQAIASTDSTKVGLCNFNSARFSVDSNGFVDTAITGPTVQTFTSGTSATYTTPANCKWIRITCTGGGGGGAGTGSSSSGGGGGNGGTTTFSGGTLSAGGGTGGAAGGGGGAGGGGTASGGNVFNVSGGTGGPRWAVGIAAIGGYGGQGYYGGAGPGGEANGGAGGAAVAAGGGGGGGGCTVTTVTAGTGGGAGATCQHIINSPSATYTYTVGAAGTAGSAGTSGVAGGAGSAGLIVVEEHYI